MIKAIANMPAGTNRLRASGEVIGEASRADWLGNAFTAFGWLMPGEVKVSGPDDARDAKQWSVGIDDD